MGRLADFIKQYKRVALDTNMFIYLLEKHPIYGEDVKELFNLIEKGQCFGVTSVLFITEVLTKPIKEQNEELMMLYDTFIKAFPNLLIRDVDYKVSMRAAKMRARYNLRTPDAIFLAVAVEEEAQVFVINDIRLKTVAEIDIILLDDYK